MKKDRKPFLETIARTEEQHGEVVKHIGSISVSFARIESYLISVLASLMEFSDRQCGEIIVDKLTYSSTVDLFDRIATHSLQDSPLAGRISPLVTDLTKVGTERNRIIHSCPVMLPEEEDEFLLKKVRKKHTKSRSRTNDEIYTIEKLSAVLIQMNSTLAELRDFHHKLVLERNAEPQTQPDNS